MYHYPSHRTSNAFGLVVLLLIIWAYIFTSKADEPVPVDRNELRAAAMKAALNRQLDAELRSAAATAVCGNAGWKISEDNKTLTCVPRKGKPYIPKQ